MTGFPGRWLDGSGVCRAGAGFDAEVGTGSGFGADSRRDVAVAFGVGKSSEDLGIGVHLAAVEGVRVRLRLPALGSRRRGGIFGID